VIDPIGVERRGTAFNPVNKVALAQQELREIGTILAGNSRNQRGLGQLSYSNGFRHDINIIPVCLCRADGITIVLQVFRRRQAV